MSQRRVRARYMQRMWSACSSISHVDCNKIICPSQASHSVTLNSPHFPSSITLELLIKEKQIKSDPWSFQVRVKRHSRSRHSGSTDVSDPRGLDDLSLTRLLVIYRFPRITLCSTSCTFEEGHCGIRSLQTLKPVFNHLGNMLKELSVVKKRDATVILIELNGLLIP